MPFKNYNMKRQKIYTQIINKFITIVITNLPTPKLNLNQLSTKEGSETKWSLELQIPTPPEEVYGKPFTLE